MRELDLSRLIDTTLLIQRETEIPERENLAEEMRRMERISYRAEQMRCWLEVERMRQAASGAPFGHRLRACLLRWLRWI